MHCLGPLHQKHRTGFTLIELLVVISIIAVLSAILFPVFAKARDKARQVACASNCKQIGLGMMQYVQDNDETFPLIFDDLDYSDYNNVPVPAGHTVDGWADAIQPYIKSLAVYQCPSAGQSGNVANSPNAATWPLPSITGFYNGSYSATGYTTYGMNGGLCFYYYDSAANQTHCTGSRSIAEVTNPAATIAVAETQRWDASNGVGNGGCTGLVYGGSPATQSGPGCSDPTYPEALSIDRDWKDARRHSNGANYSFADGHVKWFLPEKLYGSAAPFSLSGDNPTFHIHD